jgi:hypothetical protein
LPGRPLDRSRLAGVSSAKQEADRDGISNDFWMEMGLKQSETAAGGTSKRGLHKTPTTGLLTVVLKHADRSSALHH